MLYHALILCYKVVLKLVNSVLSFLFYHIMCSYIIMIMCSCVFGYIYIYTYIYSISSYYLVLDYARIYYKYSAYHRGQQCSAEAQNIPFLRALGNSS